MKAPGGNIFAFIALVAWGSSLPRAVATVSPDRHPDGVSQFSSSGPVSEEDRELLWKESREALAAGQPSRAIPRLRRLIDRYPSSKNILEARQLLGLAYLKNHQAKWAVPLLKQHAQTEVTRLSRAVSLAALARALFELGDLPGAILTAQEGLALRMAADSKEPRTARLISPESEAELLLVLAWSRLDQKLLLASEEALNSVTPLEPLYEKAKEAPPLRAEAARLKLEQRLFHCNELGQESTLSEAQVLESLKERSVCLQEALNLAFDVLALDVTSESKKAGDAWLRGWDSYVRRMKAPPPPVPPLSKDRLKAYFRELGQALDQQRLHAAMQCKEMITHRSIGMPNGAKPVITKWSGTFKDAP